MESNKGPDHKNQKTPEVPILRTRNRERPLGAYHETNLIEFRLRIINRFPWMMWYVITRPLPKADGIFEEKGSDSWFKASAGNQESILPKLCLPHTEHHSNPVPLAIRKGNYMEQLDMVPAYLQVKLDETIYTELSKQVVRHYSR